MIYPGLPRARVLVGGRGLIMASLPYSYFQQGPRTPSVCDFSPRGSTTAAIQTHRAVAYHSLMDRVEAMALASFRDFHLRSLRIVGTRATSKDVGQLSRYGL